MQSTLVFWLVPTRSGSFRTPANIKVLGSSLHRRLVVAVDGEGESKSSYFGGIRIVGDEVMR
jgi:hypothetical protein